MQADFEAFFQSEASAASIAAKVRTVMVFQPSTIGVEIMQPLTPTAPPLPIKQPNLTLSTFFLDRTVSLAHQLLHTEQNILDRCTRWKSNKISVLKFNFKVKVCHNYGYYSGDICSQSGGSVCRTREL